MTHPVIIKMLEDCVDSLAQDLSILKHQMAQNKEGMFITYDADLPAIIVHAPAKYKAYIPKRYNSWDVEFKVWDGETLELDLDLSISMD